MAKYGHVRNVLVVGVALLAVSSMLLGWGWNNAATRQSAAANQAEATRAEMERLTAELALSKDALTLNKAENDHVKQEFTALRDEIESAKSHPYVRLSPNGIDKLKAQGLKNPAEDLVAALQKRTDLIPYKGVLGGTMAFQMLDHWVITDHWVLAHADDGHHGGYVLLRYEVTNGTIQWDVLDSAKD